MKFLSLIFSFLYVQGAAFVSSGSAPAFHVASEAEANGCSIYDDPVPGTSRDLGDHQDRTEGEEVSRLHG